MLRSCQWLFLKRRTCELSLSVDFVKYPVYEPDFFVTLGLLVISEFLPFSWAFFNCFAFNPRSRSLSIVVQFYLRLNWKTRRIALQILWYLCLKFDFEFVGRSQIFLSSQQSFGIKTAGLEEKSTACQMLVCYARELKEGFVEYVEEVVKLMVPLLKFYFHDDILHVV